MVEFLAACVVAGTPLVFATVGELITEKSGSMNLGVEGMMLMGAVMGFLAGINTYNPGVALLAAALAGAAGALIFGFLTVTLRANQVVCGLTLTIFGTGFAQFVGEPLLGSSVPSDITSFFSKLSIPLLGDIPVIGPIFFQQDIFVYISYIVCALVAVYMYKTIGMNLKAVGESNAAADASGINVALYKYIHILIGGALCGLGGAYLSLGKNADLAGEHRQRTWMDRCCPYHLRSVESDQGILRRSSLWRTQHPGTETAGYGRGSIPVSGGYDPVYSDHPDRYFQYLQEKERKSASG